MRGAEGSAKQGPSLARGSDEKTTHFGKSAKFKWDFRPCLDASGNSLSGDDDAAASDAADDLALATSRHHANRALSVFGSREREDIFHFTLTMVQTGKLLFSF